jgi:predicted GNAT superfamily acetyltransferase
MAYVMPEIGPATRDDIAGMLELQESNLLEYGGSLTVRLPRAYLEASLDDLPQIVARRNGKIVGYLLSASRETHAHVPIMQAMLRAYVGPPDAYIYGPVCVAASERGQGLAAKLFDTLRARLPRRECVTFIRRDNAASLRAHLKMGMKDISSFTHDGVEHAVVVYSG